MGSEIIVPETPNWLQELEDKREKRLKARLGHEAGAGAPCLKCEDKCPGLDLHFWRKCCKICKCTKEDHEVQDDDIYGWAQFQLLGSKPSKVKKKIVLPGKKDELELDWVPKGHNETIDKYLKTLPSDRLPVKGSQAAQDRKQMLQKQIPVHDIDPTLCHELTEDELNKMNEYVAHIKQSSVGVGQIVSLSSLIKGNLHLLNPQEAAVIASRYAKGIPLSEIVKLQSQSRAGLLKQQGLDLNMHKMSLNDPITDQNTVSHQKLYDRNNPGYAESGEQRQINPQYSNPLDPNRRNPSAFVPYSTSQISRPRDLHNENQSLQQPDYAHYLPHHARQMPEKLNILGQDSDTVHTNDPYYASSLPHLAKTVSRGVTPQENVSVDVNMQNPSYANQFRSISRGSNPQEIEQARHQPSREAVQNAVPHGFENVPATHYQTQFVEANKLGDPKYARDLSNSPSVQHGAGTIPIIDPSTGRDLRNPDADKVIYSEILHPNGQLQRGSSGYVPSQSGESTDELRRSSKPPLPNYTPGKYNIHGDQQLPKIIPKNVKDLAFSTYDPTNIDPNEMQKNTGRHLDFPEDPYLANQDLAKQIIQGIPKPLVGENLFSDRGLKPPNVPQPPIPGHKPNNSNREDHLYPPIKETAANPNYTGGRKDHLYPRQKGIENYPSGRPGFYQGQKEIGAKATSSEGGQDSMYPGQKEIGAGSGYNGGRSNNLYPGQNEYPENKSGNVSQHPISGKQMPQFHPSNIRDGYMNPNQGEVGSHQGGKSGYNGGRSDNLYSGQNAYPENNSGNVSQHPISGKQMPQLHPSNIRDGYMNPNQAEVGSQQGVKSGPGKKLSELHPSNIDINEDYLHPSQVEIGAIQDIDYPEIKAATHGTNDFYEDYSPDSIREILNNIKLPDCHYCKKPFEENEFAVTIDRANVLFHAECFRCAGCNQILADNVYFYNKETDNIYCGRDYAKVRGFPRCKACDELIFTKEYCLAENATFHLKHFCCYECDTPLAGQDYVLEDEMPYCIPCFEQSKANKCSGCERVIKPDETGCALKGIHFHATDDCFSCKICHKPLMGQKFLLKNEKLYCSHQCFGVASQ